MKFGAQVGCYRNTWGSIRGVVEVLEAGPWDSIWFADHFIPPPGRRDEEHLTAHEGFTLIAAVAGITEKLKLGHLVLGNTYRNPALVAKMATTVDQISHGRFILGIGAAWFKREHEAYGWTFPSMQERQDRFEEACGLIRALITSTEPVTVEGTYYTLDEAPLSPGSFQQPHIPILVGGTGEKRTLRTLATYGDIMNLDGWAGGPMTADYFRRKCGVLDKHCENVGRGLHRQPSPRRRYGRGIEELPHRPHRRDHRSRSRRHHARRHADGRSRPVSPCRRGSVERIRLKAMDT